MGKRLYAVSLGPNVITSLWEWSMRLSYVLIEKADVAGDGFRHYRWIPKARQGGKSRLKEKEVGGRRLVSARTNLVETDLLCIIVNVLMPLLIERL
jgi:hypothetical protein